MTGALDSKDEYARLLSLAHYEVLDTLPESVFDRITRLAAYVLRTPVAMLNFVDQFRLWGKSAVGASEVSIPRSDAFCAWTIEHDQPLVVENTHTDARFRNNPLVTGAPYVHMYAGVPLVTPTGHRIGTLCVTHHQPHPLTPEDIQALQDLAGMAMSELELRVTQRRLQREVQAQDQVNTELRRTLEQARILEGVGSLMDLDLSPEDLTLAAAALLGDAISADYTGLIVFTGQGMAVKAAYHHPRVSQAARSVAEQVSTCPGGVTRTLRNLTAPLYITDYPSFPGALKEVVDVGTQQIAWIPLGTRQDRTFLMMVVRLADHPVSHWRSGDRALVEAAARSVRSALDQRLMVDLVIRQSRQDTLTGILNRRAFEEDLAAHQGPLTLAMLDLDGLKQINDHAGHDQGDKLLRIFAVTLNAAVGSGGQVYRLGGDEFVIMTSDPDEEVLLEHVDVAVLAGRQMTPEVGVSIGVAHSTEAPPQELLGLADQRMYAAKRRRQTIRLNHLTQR